MNLRMAASAASLLAFLVATASPSPAAPAPPASAAPVPADIDKDGLLILLRRVFSALQDADESGNYTVLRDIGTPGFQQLNTAVQLGYVFAVLRRQNVDLSGTLVQEPKVTALPEIVPGGVMRVAGFYPSATSRINFAFEFQPVNGRWRPSNIAVGLGDSVPAAPPQTPVPGPSVQAQPAKVAAKAAPPRGHMSARHKEVQATPVTKDASPE